jgi:hypothetical protein
MPFIRKIGRGRPVPVREERAEQMRRWHLSALVPHRRSGRFPLRPFQGFVVKDSFSKDSFSRFRLKDLIFEAAAAAH